MHDEIANDVKQSGPLPQVGEPVPIGEQAGRMQDNNAGSAAGNSGELNYRDHVQSKAGHAFRAIVERLVEQAKDGSINHIKLLFALAGIMQQLKEFTGRTKSLNRNLIDELSRELDKQQIAPSDPDNETAPAPTNPEERLQPPGQQPR